mmetsp:Transcript_31811/g.91282  ORF Transcript_31811/g.91282 Transcript_31811/m.91282 type:complete len:469 (-) Transcript_31811:1071-2477(-)
MRKEARCGEAQVGARADDRGAPALERDLVVEQQLQDAEGARRLEGHALRRVRPCGQKVPEVIRVQAVHVLDHADVFTHLLLLDAGHGQLDHDAVHGGVYVPTLDRCDDVLAHELRGSRRQLEHPGNGTDGPGSLDLLLHVELAVGAALHEHHAKDGRPPGRKHRILDLQSGALLHGLGQRDAVHQLAPARREVRRRRYRLLLGHEALSRQAVLEGLEVAKHNGQLPTAAVLQLLEALLRALLLLSELVSDRAVRKELEHLAVQRLLKGLDVGRDDAVDKVQGKGLRHGHGLLALRDLQGLLVAHAQGQGVGPVLAAEEPHRAVVGVDHDALMGQDTVGCECGHEAPRACTATKGTDGQLIRGPEHLADNVVDGVDVQPARPAPGGRVLGGMDAVEVDAIGEGIVATCQHDCVHVASIPSLGQDAAQAAALLCGHGPVVKLEHHVADTVHDVRPDLRVRLRGTLEDSGW